MCANTYGADKDQRTHFQSPKESQMAKTCFIICYFELKKQKEK